ncbi:aspartate--tRNA ligase [Patescibacteria group bacterium]|nr:aspartate--tRNA ligase [Patescibacteria group bacterium]
MQRIMNTETSQKIGDEVVIKGWVNVRRNMGKIIFLDMRDRSGIVQVVLVPSELSDRAKEVMENLRAEDCLAVTGVVNKRGEKQINPNMDTGEVEVLAKDIEVYNHAETPPFEVDQDTSKVNEELRLKYRYLDLRTERMQKNLEVRSKMITSFRKYLDDKGFLEIETPTLVKGTPEGAREYLVPSRQHPGKFYVLPQSPQQFKQLLMVAGVEKYYQIARCYRDEDARGDRQPEFTQLDLEMSFVDRGDILEVLEGMMVEMVKEVVPDKRLTFKPFKILTYAESMEKYGTDKPDLREDKNDPNELAFAWIIDFPMFELNSQGQMTTAHHPFCMINSEDEKLLETEPLKVRADTWDLVLNGYELSSGSIRIHKADIQAKIFKTLGLSDEEVRVKFGHMLEAFKFGAPPHGGSAPGLDRLAMLLCNEPSIREVIAFPKTGDASDLLMGAPSELSTEQIAEMNINVSKRS